MNNSAKTILLIIGLVMTPFLSTSQLSANQLPIKQTDVDKNEFPTAVLADYVLGCMVANGNTMTSLHQCSCSIDFIKSRMAYAEFEKAQTIMQVQLDQGQRGIFYRDSNWAKQQIDRLKGLQAESTLRCF